MAFTFTLWTNDPGLARRADAAGVDRIGLDLETRGKASRQRGLPTWISTHDVVQLPAICDALHTASPFVRCNPLNARSREEVEYLLDHGVAILMLPNFTDLGDVERFLRIVDGRATVVPLVERLAALKAVQGFSVLHEINEIHIGLNDLSIDLGFKNRLAILATDLIADAALAARDAGLRLSVGGVGRAMDDSLPVPSDLVYAQYPRLNATGALISRSFRPELLDTPGLAAEIARSRERMEFWARAGRQVREKAREALAQLCAGPGKVSGEAGQIAPIA